MIIICFDICYYSWCGNLREVYVTILRFTSELIPHRMCRISASDWSKSVVKSSHWLNTVMWCKVWNDHGCVLTSRISWSTLQAWGEKREGRGSEECSHQSSGNRLLAWALPWLGPAIQISFSLMAPVFLWRPVFTTNLGPGKIQQNWPLVLCYKDWPSSILNNNRYPVVVMYFWPHIFSLSEQQNVKIFPV